MAPSIAHAQWAYGERQPYVFLDIYDESNHDSLVVKSIIGFGFGHPIDSSNWVLEWHRPMITAVQLDSRHDNPRIASTALVLGTTMWLTAMTMLALGYNDDDINSVVLNGTIRPFGSYLGYRPTRWLTLFSGAIPDVILFSDEDGIVVSGRLGLRVDRGAGIALSAGVAQAWYWGWESPSRSFPIGFFVTVSYFSPIASALLD